jgi:tagatose-1,6-bisphosphate aldolase
VRLLLQTLVREGFKGLYKGMSAPLATVALFNAVLFASRGQMEVLLAHKDGEQQQQQQHSVTLTNVSRSTSARASAILVGQYGLHGIFPA